MRGAELGLGKSERGEVWLGELSRCQITRAIVICLDQSKLRKKNYFEVPGLSSPGQGTIRVLHQVPHHHLQSLE